MAEASRPTPHLKRMGYMGPLPVTTDRRVSDLGWGSRGYGYGMAGPRNPAPQVQHTFAGEHQQQLPHWSQLGNEVWAGDTAHEPHPDAPSNAVDAAASRPAFEQSNQTSVSWLLSAVFLWLLLTAYLGAFYIVRYVSYMFLHMVPHTVFDIIILLIAPVFIAAPVFSEAEFVVLSALGLAGKSIRIYPRWTIWPLYLAVIGMIVTAFASKTFEHVDEVNLAREGSAADQAYLTGCMLEPNYTHISLPLNETYFILADPGWTVDWEKRNQKTLYGWDFVLAPIVYRGPVKGCNFSTPMYAACIDRNTSMEACWLEDSQQGAYMPARRLRAVPYWLHDGEEFLKFGVNETQVLEVNSPMLEEVKEYIIFHENELYEQLLLLCLLWVAVSLLLFVRLGVGVWTGEADSIGSGEAGGQPEGRSGDDPSEGHHCLHNPLLQSGTHQVDANCANI